MVKQGYRSVSMAAKKLWKNAAFRRKKNRLTSEWLRKKWKDPVYAERMSKLTHDRNVANWKNSGYRQRMSKKISDFMKVVWESSGYRRKVSKSFSKARKLEWRDPEIRNKRSKNVAIANSRGPNKKEKLLEGYLNHLFPKEFKYTGDGKIVIGGRVPDFTNVNGKKQVIELFGTYWHKGEWRKKKENHYKNFGYDCLVIRERELKDLVALGRRLLKWNK